MKLRLEQLPAHIKKDLAPVYYIYGDEWFFVQQACEQIRAAARNAGYDQREVYHVEGGFQWSALSQAADTYSLFSDKTLLELRMPNGKPGDAGAKALGAYCADPPQDKLLLIQSGKLESTAQRSKWFTQLQKTGVCVQVFPIRPHQLPGWLQQRAKQRGIQLTATAIHIITERVEGNLLAAVQELEKLYLLHGDQPIDESMVLQAVADNARFNIYQLADEALAGQLGRCARILEGLKQEGEEPVLILWALVRDLRLVTEMRHASRKQVPVNSLMDQYRIWQYRQPHYRAALKRLSWEDCSRLLRQAAKIDHMIKGVHRGLVWNALLRLTAGICGQTLFHEADNSAVITME